MTHERRDSVDFSSSQSPLPPVSSTDGVINYQRLNDEIIRVQNGDADLQSLVDTAEKLIDVFAPTPQSVYTHRDCSASVRLDAMMKAMLVYAEECGGGHRRMQQQPPGKGARDCSTCFPWNNVADSSAVHLYVSPLPVKTMPSALTSLLRQSKRAIEQFRRKHPNLLNLQEIGFIHS